MSRFNEPAGEELAVEISLRVPAAWTSPEQLAGALQEHKTGYRLEGEHIVNELTGDKLEYHVTDHDDDLVKIFRGGHHGRMTEEELLAVGAHAVKVCIVGPGGSYEAAKRVIDATAALVRAGGYGVFADNSGNCHGPEDFLKLADDPNDGGAYWTFVAITGSRGGGMFSNGMHVFGQRDAELPDPPDDPDRAWYILNNFLGYTYASGVKIKDGEFMFDEPADFRFRAVHVDDTKAPVGHAMHNPYGIWRMEALLEEEP